ncbi:hypothetical protein RJ639_003943 [Escallonia herrerae]|uniref:Uncharacterized protein n=1 Tax=Escallonia herrerae TaxID=1293975 RepID=A0AA89AEG7_9ASTE|nr:hypothetical protein RJ639_021554 [Escallonia herrerae]KAK3019709.1 hypothetical protein RJ639_003943 [Escallonia herrerae]
MEETAWLAIYPDDNGWAERDKPQTNIVQLVEEVSVAAHDAIDSATTCFTPSPSVLHPLREFKCTNTAEVTPEWAIRCRPQCGVVVVNMLANQQARPIRKNDIVFGETLFHCCWRGYDKYGTGTKSEGENWTIFNELRKEEEKER